MKLLLGLIFIGLFCYSCNKENNSPEFPFKAEVIGLNPDCGIYQIRITQGLDLVKSIAGTTSGDSIYIANNLPDELKINGLRIILNLRKPQNNELGICTALGPGYTWIFVTKAEKE
jgi:hypothetical protein